ncbi:MAG: Pvc16 family protein [Planctomycetota bacterium JB042]
MADADVIRDTGETLVGLLREGIPDWLLPHDRIMVGSYAEFAQLPALDAPRVTVFLHRIEVRYRLRTTSQDRGMPLRLSYLVTPWAMRADDDHRLLGRVLQVLDAAAVVGPDERRGDAWGPDDTLQFVIDEMSRETELGLWEAMKLPFRASIACHAQVFQLDPS